MMEIVKEKLEDQEVNFVEVGIRLESGCDWREGEYSLHINSFIGSLDIFSIGGVDDITRIKECIDENIDGFV